MTDLNNQEPEHQHQHQQQQQQHQTVNLRSSLKPPKNNSTKIYEENYGLSTNPHQHHYQSELETLKTSLKQPQSILKRYDSSEKMNPISRPISHCEVPNHHNFNNHTTSTTLPRNMNPHNSGYSSSHQRNKLNSTYMADSDTRNVLSSTSAACIQPRKRVQFANIPPLNTCSSVGDLSSNTRANRFTNEPQFSRSSRGHRDRSNRGYHESSRRHKSHHGSGHRRSSSTSNFNTSTMSARSGRSGSRGYNQHRAVSNRSLNMVDNYEENDYDEYNSACEFDDDRTCSTCSFSSSNSSSTESDLSDLEDGFGCDPIENYRRGGYPRNNSTGQMQLGRNNFSSSQRGAAASGDPLNRKYNPGLKISYVDSLPLARTNPAPQEPKKSKSSGSSSNKKKKSISKFKKDNCTVS